MASRVSRTTSLLFGILFTLQLLLLLERSVFDGLGRMWLFIATNLLHACTILVAIFACRRKTFSELCSLIFWNVIWILWNLSAIFVYQNVFQHPKLLSMYELNLPHSRSWFFDHGVLCHQFLLPLYTQPALPRSARSVSNESLSATSDNTLAKLFNATWTFVNTLFSDTNVTMTNFSPSLSTVNTSVAPLLRPPTLSEIEKADIPSAAFFSPPPILSEEVTKLPQTDLFSNTTTSDLNLSLTASVHPAVTEVLEVGEDASSGLPIGLCWPDYRHVETGQCLLQITLSLMLMLVAVRHLHVERNKRRGFMGKTDFAFHAMPKSSDPSEKLLKDREVCDLSEHPPYISTLPLGCAPLEATVGTDSSVPTDESMRTNQSFSDPTEESAALVHDSTVHQAAINSSQISSPVESHTVTTHCSKLNSSSNGDESTNGERALVSSEPGSHADTGTTGSLPPHRHLPQHLRPATSANDLGWQPKYFRGARVNKIESTGLDRWMSQPPTEGSDLERFGTSPTDTISLVTTTGGRRGAGGASRHHQLRQLEEHSRLIQRLLIERERRKSRTNSSLYVERSPSLTNGDANEDDTQ